MRIFGKKYMTQEEWEETPHGKKFTEKMKAIAEENQRKKDEWEQNADPKRVAVYKRLKKISPCFYIPFALALFAGGVFGSLLYILLAEAFLSVTATVLYFVFPNEKEGRSSFLFIPLAFVAAVLCWATILSAQLVDGKFWKTDAASEAKAASSKEESASGEYEGYEDFLKKNVLDDGDELYDHKAAAGESGDD